MNRKKWIFISICWMIGTVCLMAQTVPQWPEVTTEMRPGSRWWWMGSAVDADNLQRNITEYAKTGIGTLEITPIYGVTGNERNELKYLSEGWMNALKTCQQIADEQHVDIDMNGGTGWPFGGPWVKTSEAAGKLVTKSETLTADGSTEITFSVKSPEGNAPLNKVMGFQQDGDQQVVELTSLVENNTLKWMAPAGQWLIIAVYDGHTGQQVKRAAPGGEGPVLDHYDADAVKNYLTHFDQAFESTDARWPHTFFNDSYEVYGADWTPKMFSEFEKYRGYKLEEHMDQLLGLGKRKDANNQVLADYRQTLSDMLLNNFIRQWTAWAHSHGATTRNQGHGSPGNLIDFYAAVDIPEIEGFGITDFKIKGLRTDPGFTSANLSDLATLKYASSAAHLTGKKMTSSETFTWLAEHFRVSLSQMKPDVDLMFIAGVNHIFFHGTTYSPQEAAWPGWKFYASVDMSPTNSIWRDAPSFMQYATRCQSFLQMGLPDNDVLVYAPFQDAMHKNSGANAARLQLFDINTLSQKIPSMATAVNNLEKAGLDCDFISDALLLETTFKDGVLQTAAGTRYRALVIPVKTNIPQSVVDHLTALESQGAKIVYGTEMTTIASLGLQGEEIRTQLGLRMIRRQNDTGHHYFVTNLSPTDARGMVSLAVPFQSAALFNPMTGAIKQAYIEDGKVWISLKSGESLILQTYNTTLSLAEKDVPVTEMDGISILSKWKLSFTDDTYAPQTPGSYDLDKPLAWEQLDAATASLMGTGVYETTFTVEPRVLALGNAGMRIDLGDVRESARVYINNEYVGCAWSAPFMLDCSRLLHEGENSLRIEVTNLPANRIRQMDLDGVKWRIFKDVNILDVVNGNTSQSNITYNNWSLVPSGLNSDVKLVPLRNLSKELLATLVGFEQEDFYYPLYRLTTPTGLAIDHIKVTDLNGTEVNGYSVRQDNTHIIIKGRYAGYLIVTATDTNGNTSQTCVSGNGAYQQCRLLDFMKDEAPACGWQVMTNKTSMTGFNGSYAWRRAPEKNSAKQVTLADGVVANAEKASYYFFYPGYGVAVTNDAELEITAEEGDISVLSYMVGSASKVDYQAADSLVAVVECKDGDKGISHPLSSRNANHVYRMLQLFRPVEAPLSVTPVVLQSTNDADGYYSLQGVRVSRPQRGIYIRNGRKVIFR